MENNLEQIKDDKYIADVLDWGKIKVRGKTWKYIAAKQVLVIIENVTE